MCHYVNKHFRSCGCTTTVQLELCGYQDDNFSECMRQTVVDDLDLDDDDYDATAGCGSLTIESGGGKGGGGGGKKRALGCGRTSCPSALAATATNAREIKTEAAVVERYIPPNHPNLAAQC